jgi:hypothetical protein
MHDCSVRIESGGEPFFSLHRFANEFASVSCHDLKVTSRGNTMVVFVCQDNDA